MFYSTSKIFVLYLTIYEYDIQPNTSVLFHRIGVALGYTNALRIRGLLYVFQSLFIRSFIIEIWRNKTRILNINIREQSTRTLAKFTLSVVV